MSFKEKINDWSYMIFLILCLLILVLGFMILRLPESSCDINDIQTLNRISNQISTPEIVEGVDTIVDGIIVKTPVDACRAHFSGLLMSDHYKENWKSEVFVIDDASEYVGEGDYPRAIEAFPKSHQTTFDGIAIDKRTRVIIYEKPFFKGKILLDEVGPLIITNNYREGDLIVTENNNKIFSGDLNVLFPPNRRIMSSSNMFDWSKGSLKVICNE